MEEEIQTIEEEFVVAGVSSVDGKTGDVSLKTINGEELTGSGNIEIEGSVTSVNNVTPDENGNVALTASDVGAQATLSEAQLSAVNSGIDSTKVGQIATNTSDITAIEGMIPSAASSSNQLADKNFVNSSVATNTANYISDNGEPFDSLADLEAYSGTLTNNDYAFVVGTDSAGNTTYTRYKYNADTEQWAEEYVLNNSSFTSDQWAAINSGITTGDVAKLTDFTGTDGTAAGATGLVPAPTTSDGNKFLKGDGTWGIASPTVVQTTGNSTTDIMSQDAVTGMVFADPGTESKIRIGNTATIGDKTICIGKNITGGGANNVAIGGSIGSGVYTSVSIGIGASAINNFQEVAIGSNASCSGRGGVAIGSSAVATAGRGVALGENARATYDGSVALGSNSSVSHIGEVNIGTSSSTQGYNGTSTYRLLSGVYDPQNAHDAATKGYVDTHLGGLSFVALTQNEYDALQTKDANTLYIIKAA